ncbi:ATP-binding protein [Pseudofrankia sp. BMG5.37]|uniref:ATP-binding protein n=1 Tax=Pseudofrankia sp. BMG5.37 TaxID=3050035 RepID=UPI00289554E4|nr:ATP-binding protein [Pseudofrankia sp. BMG5.37]MDT3442422.1 ATP-binding protein [Pseudofrankia sp. BMG5.37]
MAQRRRLTQAQDPLAAQAEGERLSADAERHRLEARRHEARRLESLGKLAGGIAHDFNNLLAVVTNYASFVTEEIAAVAAESGDDRWKAVLNDVGQIQHAAERATALTRQLLAFGRREAIQPRVLSLNRVVADLEQALRDLVGEEVRLTISLHPDAGSVFADHDQLEQVLVNLVANAREAMPDGGVLSIDTANVDLDEDTVAARVGLRPGPHARLRVSDNGVGIPADLLGLVFEPFFTTKVKGEGSGLGLATVYGVISQFGGHTEIASEEGAGTTVTCLLPEADAEAAETGPLVTVPRSTVPVPGSTDDHAGGGETILLVEDEDAIREVTQRILARNGYQVLTAAGAAEAIALVGGRHEARDDIDLLITDVIMPGMHGGELAGLIRALLPTVRVAYMSGYAHPVLAARGRLDADVILLKKPFTEGVLLETVRRTLNSD